MPDRYQHTKCPVCGAPFTAPDSFEYKGSCESILLDACERAEWWLSTVPESGEIVKVLREAITAAREASNADQD